MGSFIPYVRVVESLAVKPSGSADDGDVLDGDQLAPLAVVPRLGHVGGDVVGKVDRRLVDGLAR